MVTKPKQAPKLLLRGDSFFWGVFFKMCDARIARSPRPWMAVLEKHPPKKAVNA